MNSYKVLKRYGELRDLPNGSVVLDRDGEAWQKNHVGYWRPVGDHKDYKSPTGFYPLTLVFRGRSDWSKFA